MKEMVTLRAKVQRQRLVQLLHDLLDGRRGGEELEAVPTQRWDGDIQMDLTLWGRWLCGSERHREE